MRIELNKRIDRSLTILDRVVNIHDPSHLFALFSGGHDSLVATHITSQHSRFSGVVHLNTGIGIKETREFVRNTCDKHGWELIELHPQDKTYEELVLEKGFPHGPKSHNTMYYYLKQLQIQTLIQEYKTHWYDRILLSSGIRLEESTRRMNKDFSTIMRRHGAQVWVNPILYWSALDCSKYIEEKNLDRNEVVDFLHKSGECLCGALAYYPEMEEIELWYPDAAKRIHKLEERCYKKGLVDYKWAVSNAPGKTWDEVDFDRDDVDMPLCQSCIND